MSRPSRTAAGGRLRAPLLLLLALGALLCLPGAARADLFGPISLVSSGELDGGPPEQAEYAHDAAISGDGLYVAFDGSIGGRTGVWRRDLATGVVEQVAGGDAELPSISEDGRYISFTSTEALVPEDETKGPNVWVRDMEPAPGEPEYVLASAQDGSSKGLLYEYGANPAQEEQDFGASATGRTAISADGQEVAFVTTASSDLAGPDTPPLQVAVRYLQSDRTVLVSRCYECADSSEPVSGGEPGRLLGAVYPGSTRGIGFRATPADAFWAADPPPGASISADGSTVAWMGEDVDRQVAMLPQETPAPLYTEPLWRRIEPGSETPTERVTGGSEPGNPACQASGETVLPEIRAQSAADPCQGPFEVELVAGAEGSRGIWSETAGGGEADFVPRLSGDGYTVAFLSSAVPTRLGRGFGTEPEGEPADLYVADMHPGVSRNAALTPLTEIGGENAAAASPVTDFEISRSGEQVAFATRRIEFTLGSPALVSPVAAETGESELFDVDRADGTVTRVTRGFASGEPSEQAHGSKLSCPEAEDVYCNPITIGAQSPSFTSDGAVLAFSSTASNLAFGDGNSPRNPFGTPEGPYDGSDAFVVERLPVVALPTPEYISPAPATSTEPDWGLGATAVSRRDGSVVVYVAVPGQGTLRGAAASAVRVAVKAGRSARGRTRGKQRVREMVLTRTVANATKAVDGLQEIVELVLRPAKAYASLAAQKGGLSSALGLSFAAPGHPTLHETIAITFARTLVTKSAKARGARRRRARSSRRREARR